MTGFEWSEAKRAANLAKHGIDFTAIHAFDWSSAIVERDDRVDYGEERFAAYGRIGTRLHFVAFTLRNGTRRIISLRKTNDREDQAYGRKRQTRPSDP